MSPGRAGTQVREELSFAISQPIEHPERFAAMGLSTATGVLLYGPPGAYHDLSCQHGSCELRAPKLSACVSCAYARAAVVMLMD